MAFNRCGTTRTVALDIAKGFDWIWHAGFLHKLKSYVFLLFSIVDVLDWFWMESLLKNI